MTLLPTKLSPKPTHSKWDTVRTGYVKLFGVLFKRAIYTAKVK